ncbi:hypothetical protein [Parasitella parasitica]|uniref:Transcription initiation factor TFIID subunit 10 n=1 Tax=Parasitella parasitica TaxID=35722 RepID=A0A0B7NRT1_9FUNG|nr:hypothetical protein [Parasitella parasitica]
MNPSTSNNEQYIQQQSTDNLDISMNDNEQPMSTPTEKIDKEKDMAELLMTMDSYTPIIPDAVIDYYLNKTGFDCDDARIKKLFALAAQKFVADIATDAFQFNQVKQSSRATSKSNKEKKIVLTMDDLSSALNEYGLNVKKPEYYQFCDEVSKKFNITRYKFDPSPKVIPKVLRPEEQKLLKKVKSTAKFYDAGFSCCCFKIGMDALIGIIPVVGDFITTLVALNLIRVACKAKLPKYVISRMMINVAIDFWAGLAPVLGDILDVWFKCNTRNAQLLEEFLVKRRMDEIRLECGEEIVAAPNIPISMPKLVASVKQISPNIPSPFKPDPAGGQKEKTYTTYFR